MRRSVRSKIRLAVVEQFCAGSRLLEAKSYGPAQYRDFRMEPPAGARCGSREAYQWWETWGRYSRCDRDRSGRPPFDALYGQLILHPAWGFELGFGGQIHYQALE